MTPEYFESCRATLHDEWMKAEQFIKKSERISNEALIPAIKELRYAGRRYFQAYGEHKQQLPDARIQAHLTEAIENCKKARHDAIDGSIAFVHGELDLLIDKAGIEVIAAGFPEYSSLRSEMREVSEIIVSSRRNRSEIDGHYDSILEKHLDAIIDFYGRLEDSREVIAAILRKRRKDFWLATVTVGLVVGLISGAAVLIADKAGWFERFKSDAKPSSVSPHRP